MTHHTTFRRPSDHIDEMLENRILQGLAMEWESARGNLSFDEIRQMKKPVFSLKQGESRLAQWNNAKREIAFSRSFVKNYSWDAVREVLVHEMAHQYVHEVLHCGHETAHGPAFRKACDRLKANPKASGTYAPLTDRLNKDDVSKEDNILRKVKKLFALGQSSNPHEAEAALAKARELIESFNVDCIESHKDPDFISVFVGNPTLRRFKEDYLIARLLVDHYHVYGIWVSAFVLEKGKMGRVFEITGRPENVKTAAYVHDFILNQMNMAWATVNKTNTLGRYKKSDFASGLIQGFSTKLDQEKQNESHQTSHHKDLVSLARQDEHLMVYAAYKYPRIRRISRPDRSVDPSIRKKGEDIGSKLILSKAVEQNTSDSIKALVYHKS